VILQLAVYVYFWFVFSHFGSLAGYRDHWENKTSQNERNRGQTRTRVNLMVLWLIEKFFLSCEMCQVGGLRFWLVRSFLGIYFLISQIFIGKFVVESAPSTVQVLVLLLPIDKIACFQLFTLSVFCLKICRNSNSVVKEWRWLISESQLEFVISVSCMGLSYFMAS